MTESSKGKLLRNALVMIAVFSFCVSARAELVAYDGFDYRVTPLAQQSGGYGWRTPWYKDSVDVPSDLVVQPWQNLIMDNYNYGIEMGSIKINAGHKGLRAMESRWPLSVDATYYMSWIVEPASSSYVIWKLGYLGSTISERATVTWSAGKVGVQIRDNGSLTAKVYSADNASPVGERRLIVLKFVASQNSPDQLMLKLYAPGDQIDEDDSSIVWDASVSGSDDYFIDAVGIICSSSASTDMDEFRAGSEWVDVVPVSDYQKDPDLLAYEGFVYDSLKLTDANGGYGWVGPWYGEPNLTPEAGAILSGDCPMDLTANMISDADGLPFIPVGGMVLEAVDSKPGDAEVTDDYAYRYLKDASSFNLNQNADYYMSFLVRRDDFGTGSSAEYFAIKLAQRGLTEFYEKMKFSVGSEEEYRFSLWDSDSSTLVDTPPSNPSMFEMMKTYFCVIKIAAQDNSDPANYDRLSAVLYGPEDTISSTEPAAWTYQSNMLANSDDVLDVLLFYTGRTAVLSFDELRIGKTWASVAQPVQNCGFTGIGYDEADINADCSVNMLDLSMLADRWLQ